MRTIIVKTDTNRYLKIQIIEITEKTVAYKNLDFGFDSIQRISKEEFNNYEIVEECKN